MERKGKPLFALGSIVATPGALDAIREAAQVPADFLSRHVRGDWGDVCAEDKEENIFSIKAGFRILSSYTTKREVKLWVITESDRSSTCILLPEEY